MTDPALASGEVKCPDCGLAAIRRGDRCSGCGLSWEELEVAADFFDKHIVVSHVVLPAPRRRLG